MRVRVALLFALVVAGWLWLDARAQSNEPIVSGAHRFQKVTDGVYYATSSGTMNVGANSPIFITDNEAIVIDSETSPAAARALVTDLKAITDKPVKYVIDSHYHYDHAHGNQIFGPDVQVIGHTNTRKRLLTNILKDDATYLRSVEGIPARVENLKKQIAEATDPQQKSTFERQMATSLGYLEAVKEIKVTPPNVTFKSDMTVFRSGRELQLLYLGRGHTDTDVVVYLPQQRIVATGDLMESQISYMGDSYPEEWIATLDRLRALDFDTVMPGHGVVFKGKTKIEAFQGYLRDVIRQTTELRKQGASPEDAARKIDVTKFSGEFPGIRGVGVDVAGVRRIYKLAASPEPAQ